MLLQLNLYTAVQLVFVGAWLFICTVYAKFKWLFPTLTHLQITAVLWYCMNGCNHHMDLWQNKNNSNESRACFAFRGSSYLYNMDSVLLSFWDETCEASDIFMPVIWRLTVHRCSCHSCWVASVVLLCSTSVWLILQAASSSQMNCAVFMLTFHSPADCRHTSLQQWC